MATKNHTPYAIGAVDSSGSLVALLVAVRVSTLNGLGAMLSTRSIMYAEPIYLENESGLMGIHALIERHDEDARHKVLFSEIRPNFANTQKDDPFLQRGYQHFGYLNYELAIDRSEQALFAEMSEKRRNNVRSAIRRGVVVREVELSKGIGELYQLVTCSYRHAKVPVADESLFESVSNKLEQGRTRLLIAYYKDRPVSAGCFLCYKNRVVCWYAGTSRIPGIHSMSLVFWEAIRRFSREGFHLFDLAGAGWEGERYGPGKFKSKFGGKQTNYGRYRKIYSRWKLTAASKAFQWIRRLDLFPNQPFLGRP